MMKLKLLRKVSFSGSLHLEITIVRKRIKMRFDSTLFILTKAIYMPG